MADINERVDTRDSATELKTPDLTIENAMILLHPNLSFPSTYYKVQIPIYG